MSDDNKSDAKKAYDAAANVANAGHVARHVTDAVDAALPDVVDAALDALDGAHHDVFGPVATIYRAAQVVNMPESERQGMIDYATGKDQQLSDEGRAGAQKIVDTLASTAGTLSGVPLGSFIAVQAAHRIDGLTEKAASVVGNALNNGRQGSQEQITSGDDGDDSDDDRRSLYGKTNSIAEQLIKQGFNPRKGIESLFVDLLGVDQKIYQTAISSVMQQLNAQSTAQNNFDSLNKSTNLLAA